MLTYIQYVFKIKIFMFQEMKTLLTFFRQWQIVYCRIK
jgi:hypothetical protein